MNNIRVYAKFIGVDPFRDYGNLLKILTMNWQIKRILSLCF